MALNIIYRRKKNHFIIFSDSMSSVQAVKSVRLELDVVYQIIKEYSHLTESGKRIVICWIPSHVNIPVMRRLTPQPSLLLLSLLPK